MPRKITFFGAGYVGLVSAACFADAGHQVTVVDVDEARVERINNGESVIYEPGLSELLTRVVGDRLVATVDVQAAIAEAEALFIAVGTPCRADGTADLKYVDAVAATIAEHVQHPVVVVNKSTVPVGTAARVQAILDKGVEARGLSQVCQVVSNPEFLREGCAIGDFTRPDRVVIGSNDQTASELMVDIYETMGVQREQIQLMSPPSAEITKYAANTFLAARITLINEIAELASTVDADIEDVARAVGMDQRVGPHFLQAGPGYGGSCFPKDVQALAHSLREHNLDASMCEAVHHSNGIHKQWPWRVFERHCHRKGQALRVAVWGLAFKPDTDDVRDAASLDLIPRLINAGHEVVAYDPEAVDTFAHACQHEKLRYAASASEALEESDVLILLTQWAEFADWTPAMIAERCPGITVIDARRVFGPEEMAEVQLQYHSTGRQSKSGRA